MSYLKFGDSKDKTGIHIQEEVYKKHKLINKRNVSHMLAQPNELWIRVVRGR